MYKITVTVNGEIKTIVGADAEIDFDTAEKRATAIYGNDAVVIMLENGISK